MAIKSLLFYTYKNRTENLLCKWVFYNALLQSQFHISVIFLCVVDRRDPCLRLRIQNCLLQMNMIELEIFWHINCS